MHPLQPDTRYPIFNPTNGFGNVFRKDENFYFFREKYRFRQVGETDITIKL